jgi:hypothetical protein
LAFPDGKTLIRWTVRGKKPRLYFLESIIGLRIGGQAAPRSKRPGSLRKRGSIGRITAVVSIPFVKRFAVDLASVSQNPFLTAFRAESFHLDGVGFDLGAEFPADEGRDLSKVAKIHFFRFLTLSADEMMMVLSFAERTAQAVWKLAIFGGKLDQEPQRFKFFQDPVDRREPQTGYLFDERRMNLIRGFARILFRKKTKDRFPLRG